MDFRLDREQLMIRSTARDFLAARAPSARVREIAASGGWDEGLWRAVSDLGWIGLVVPAEFGGAGMTLVELGVLAEELGAALLPLPILSTALAGFTIAQAGSERQRADLLPELAAGRRPGALVPAEEFEPGGGDYVAEMTEEGALITGTRRLVPHAAAARLLVDSFRVRGDRGAEFVPVALPVEGRISVRPHVSLDVTRSVGDVAFERVVLTGAALPDRSAYARAQDAAIAIGAAELAGVGRRALELSVDYAGKREQFGRLIGSFQAVKHLCAEMKVICENAWSVAYNAIWACEAGDPTARRAASMAKAYCGPAIVRVCEMAVQVHGGMAFTSESDVHLYLKRALSTAARFGSTEMHRRRVLAELGVG